MIMWVFTNSNNRRDKFVAAGKAVHKHKKNLTDTIILDNSEIACLSQIKKVKIIGGLDNSARKDLVSIYVDDIPSIEIVKKINDQGIRTRLRKADHYSGNILHPLKQESCVRVSLCRYNSISEVTKFC